MCLFFSHCVPPGRTVQGTFDEGGLKMSEKGVARAEGGASFFLESESRKFPFAAQK